MSPKEYAQLLYEVLEGKSENKQDKILDNLKEVLERKRQTYLAPSIIKELDKIQTQKTRERTTYISSAAELTRSQKKEIEDIFTKPLEFFVNPSLLGGVALRQKDVVYNATLRKKIETLGCQL
jgi:F0F1-type ATP synthase delta subunit